MWQQNSQVGKASYSMPESLGQMKLNINFCEEDLEIVMSGMKRKEEAIIRMVIKIRINPERNIKR